MEKDSIPRKPTSLKAFGKSLWVRAWSSPTVTEGDYDAILMLCKLADERERMMKYLEENGDLLWINNNTNLVLHPYVKRLGEIEKQLIELLNALGFTPNARARMGYEAQDNSNPIAAYAAAVVKVTKSRRQV